MCSGAEGTGKDVFLLHKAYTGRSSARRRLNTFSGRQLFSVFSFLFTRQGRYVFQEEEESQVCM